MAFHGNPLDLTIADDDIIAASILYNSLEYLPSVPLVADDEATLCRNGPFPVEYSLEYNLETLTPYLTSESMSQWTETHSNSLLVSTTDSENHVQFQDQSRGGGTNLTATSNKTVEGYGPDPWTQIQRAFLQFLVENGHFLHSLPDSTQHSITKVKHAFEQTMHWNSLTFNPSADLDIIVQQFKAEVATPAIRRECDLKKKDATSTGEFSRWSADVLKSVELVHLLDACFRLFQRISQSVSALPPLLSLARSQHPSTPHNGMVAAGYRTGTRSRRVFIIEPNHIIRVKARARLPEDLCLIKGDIRGEHTTEYAQLTQNHYEGSLDSQVFPIGTLETFALSALMYCIDLFGVENPEVE
ncbi:hypothetical protein BDN70DRAFT_898119 [Pholiota conissans]|uniref:Uncharacterized protein n=1 Tax=Pholiota conissans TaxID=109636 RepID=A0A9P6CXE1_9AGAR|nr:hypothetical protein BDN70DRAFT_898119 [Pholiota conissans]